MNMENTRIWAALNALKGRELRLLERFVASPFFNRNEALVRLLAYFIRCLADKRPPEKPAAREAAFPGNQADDGALRLACSDLLGLVERFWVYQAQQNDPALTQLALAEALHSRGLNKPARAALLQAMQFRESTSERDATWFDFRFRAGMLQYQDATATRRYDAFNLQETSDALDAAYLIRKLRHVCLALSHQTVFAAEYQFGPLPAFFQWIESDNLTRHPVLALYYHACRFLLEPAGEGHFATFRQVLAARPETLPEDERRTLYLLALNFGIKRGNERGAPWHRETFELYRNALGQGLLLEHGRISRFAFNNMIGLAIRLQEIEWAEAFLSEYAAVLENNQRPVTLALTRAQLAFARRDYDAALAALQSADYRDFLNNLVARILQLKIYFETDAWELLEHHLQNMERYVRRHRVAGYHRDNARMLIHFTRLLMRTPVFETGKREMLRKEIAETPVLTEREWLLSVVGGR